jgi:hypothetical protein
MKIRNTVFVASFTLLMLACGKDDSKYTTTNAYQAGGSYSVDCGAATLSASTLEAYCNLLLKNRVCAEKNRREQFKIDCEPEGYVWTE